MKKISTENIQPEKKLFHDIFVDVYPKRMPLKDIDFWIENGRTLFTFERLCREKDKKLEDIPADEVTRYVAEQDVHKLQALSESIKRNGIQVPLIVQDDGKLLDGNRRYFASLWLGVQCKELNEPFPEHLNSVPVLIVRSSDLNPELELKILAEANFVPSLKVAWPLDAQARTIKDYYQNLINRELVRDEALYMVSSTFGITKQRTIDLLDTLELIEIFLSESASDDDKIRRKAIVEEKFIYFWEFKNKAMRGKGAYRDPVELREVRDLFFGLLLKGLGTFLKNVKQIEPLVQARRDNDAWQILLDSEGSKLDMVVAMLNEKRSGRISEDRIRMFLSWLMDTDDFTPEAITQLNELVKVAQCKAGK